MTTRFYRLMMVIVATLMLSLTGCHPDDGNEMADVHFDFDFAAMTEKESSLSGDDAVTAQNDTVTPEKDAADTEVNDIDNGDVPKVDYTIKGIVTDTKQAPIKGIQVELMDTYLKTTTDGTGSFTLLGIMPYGPYTSPNLHYTDVDGADGGGHFKDATREIKLFCEESTIDPWLTYCVNDQVTVSLVEFNADEDTAATDGPFGADDDQLLTDDDQ
jgi:hypothetical protein